MTGDEVDGMMTKTAKASGPWKEHIRATRLVSSACIGCACRPNEQLTAGDTHPVSLTAASAASVLHDDDIVAAEAVALELYWLGAAEVRIWRWLKQNEERRIPPWRRRRNCSGLVPGSSRFVRRYSSCCGSQPGTACLRF